MLTAGIFDLDGVLVDTTHTHYLSWKQTFDTFFKQCSTANDQSPFTRQEFLTFVNGKPRLVGIQDELRSRQLDLPLGSPDDSMDAMTVHGLSHKKQHHFLDLIQKEPVEVFSSTVAFIKILHQHHIRTGLATSSKNCSLIMEKTGIKELFSYTIDGVKLENMHLFGKPHPDIFLTAAKALNASPRQTLVVEDAISGIDAAHRGQFGLIIGVDRKKTHHHEFLEHGAHLVVQDLRDLTWPMLVSHYAK